MNKYDYNEELDEYYFEKLGPNELIFAIGITPEDSISPNMPFVIITPREYFEDQECLCDQYCGHDFLDGIVHNIMESTFELEDGLSLESARQKLIKLGLTEEPDLLDIGNL